MIDRRSVIKFKEKEDRYWSLLGSLQIFQSSWACLVMLLRKSGTSSCFENLLVTLRLMFELIKTFCRIPFSRTLREIFQLGRWHQWISAGLPIPCDWELRGTAGETRDFFGKWCRATQFGIDYDAWTRAVIIKTPNNKLVESKACRGWKSFANLSKGRRALKPSSHWHVIYFTNELPRCLYGLLHAKIRLPRSGEDYVAGVVYVLSVRIHDFTSRSVDGWGQERPP